MSYANPNREFYTFDHDFGAAGEVQSIKGPKGKIGRLIDIIVNAREAFADGAGAVKIGTGSNDDAFASFVIGTVADTDSVRASWLTDPDWLIDEVIPADTQVEITFGATGGSATGIGTVIIIIDWAD